MRGEHFFGGGSRGPTEGSWERGGPFQRLAEHAHVRPPHTSPHTAKAKGRGTAGTAAHPAVLSAPASRPPRRYHPPRPPPPASRLPRGRREPLLPRMRSCLPPAAAGRACAVSGVGARPGAGGRRRARYVEGGAAGLLPPALPVPRPSLGPSWGVRPRSPFPPCAGPRLASSHHLRRDGAPAPRRSPGGRRLAMAAGSNRPPPPPASPPRGGRPEGTRAAPWEPSRPCMAWRGERGSAARGGRGGEGVGPAGGSPGLPAACEARGRMRRMGWDLVVTLSGVVSERKGGVLHRYQQPGVSSQLLIS